MKKNLCIMLSVALFSGACAMAESGSAQPAKEHLLDLLNSRLAENRVQYEASLNAVAADAAAGMALHQFTIAALAKEIPGSKRKALKLDDAKLERYAEHWKDVDRLARSKDNSFAHYLLSLIATNPVVRVQRLERAAKGDNVQALTELGLAYLDGAGCKKNPGRAVSLFRRAADKSDPNGCSCYGWCLLYGVGCSKDPAAAVSCLRMAEKANHPQALNLLGVCSLEGTGAAFDPEAAAAFFRRSAKLGCAAGSLNYARAILAGKGEPRDVSKAMDCMKRSAEAGYVEGMYAYASALIDGLGEELKPEARLVGEELDAVRAENEKMRHSRRSVAFRYLYHCALVKNHAPSMTLLGDCYMKGLGVEPDPPKATVLYHRAAIGHGYGPAMTRMADAFDSGSGGLEKDHEKALWWRTRERAMAGDRCARIYLGRIDPHRFDSLSSLGGIKE